MALNSDDYAELFVLDSRFRGNDDLWVLPLVAMVASSGLVTVTAATAPLPTPSPTVTTVPTTAARLLSVATASLWLVIPAKAGIQWDMSVGAADGTLPLPVTPALNSVGCAEFFVLDSRVRGNDDLWAVVLVAMVASSGHNAPSATTPTAPLAITATAPSAPTPTTPPTTVTPP